MSKQTWRELVAWNKLGSGLLFNTYTTAKTVLPPGCLLDLPKNYFQMGSKLRIEILAGISNRVTGPDTMTMQVMLGATAVASTGAINLTTTANTLRACKINIDLDLQVDGAAAQFMQGWELQGIPFAQVASHANFIAGDGQLILPDPPALGTAFDDTVALTLDFFVAQSVSNAGNGIQIRSYKVFSDN